MRRTLIAGLVAGMAGIALAAQLTTLTAFETFIQHKFGPSFGTFIFSGKFKSFCVCMQGSDVGTVETLPVTPGSSTTVKLICSVPQFDTNGNIANALQCPTAWVLLR